MGQIPRGISAQARNAGAAPALRALSPQQRPARKVVTLCRCESRAVHRSVARFRLRVLRNVVYSRSMPQPLEPRWATPRPAPGALAVLPRLVTVRDLARYLGCSTRSIQRWQHRGIIKKGVYHHRGKGWRRYDPVAVLLQLQERGKR